MLFTLNYLGAKKEKDRKLDNQYNSRISSTLTTLRADYTISRGFSLDLAMPVAVLFTSVTRNNKVVETAQFGLSDLTSMLHYNFTSLYSNKERWPALQVGLGMSFPTGKGMVRLEGDAGTQLSVGSGTFDLLAQLLLSWQPVSRVALFLSSQLQQPLHAAKMLTLGTSFQCGLGAYWQVWAKKMGLQLSVESEYTATAIEEQEGQSPMQNSGGFSLFVAPAWSIVLTRGLLLQLRGRIPVYQYVNGVQLVPQFAISTSLSYTFSSFASKK